MYFTNFVLGLSGSGLRRYKYSAICFNTLIKKLYAKGTVGTTCKAEKGLVNLYGAGFRRTLFCERTAALIFRQSGEACEK